MAQFMWKMLPILILILKIEFVHFWWQKCGCCWSMVQSYMPKSVPSCLIILSNQPIFHYVMRLMYQIFILSVYHYFTTKTCCHVKLLGFSAINWSSLLEFEIQDWEHGWDRFFQYEKMYEVRTSLIFWFKLIYKQNTPVSGRFLEKKNELIMLFYEKNVGLQRYSSIWLKDDWVALISAPTRSSLPKLPERKALGNLGRLRAVAVRRWRRLTMLNRRSLSDSRSNTQLGPAYYVRLCTVPTEPRAQL